MRVGRPGNGHSKQKKYNTKDFYLKIRLQSDSELKITNGSQMARLWDLSGNTHTYKFLASVLSLVLWLDHLPKPVRKKEHKSDFAK
jgi:hypothetical protein